MDLFDRTNDDTEESILRDQPLAYRMRPRDLCEFAGQEHIVGPGKLLRRLIESDRVSSLVFYGPPGAGKTSLSLLIARMTNRRFSSVSAVTSNVAELRKIIEKAKYLYRTKQQKTLVFIDEIHRFNKAQQDVLLPHLENGDIGMIGATTENPFFALNAPVISRSQVFRLKVLDGAAIIKILDAARTDKERGLGEYRITIDNEAYDVFATLCAGDARKALNALEVAVRSTAENIGDEVTITKSIAEESIQQKLILYDRKGDQHYDTISVFIKSMRGGDPDATLYWLAKMLEAGEDINFIARRIVICASEDIGNADPMALVVAVSALDAVKTVGLPEARIPLAQAAVYLACAPKSNAAYLGIDAAVQSVKKEKTQAVPGEVKNKKFFEDKNKVYLYPHNYEGHLVEQEYMPEKKQFYIPTQQGYEKEISERLDEWRKTIRDRNIKEVVKNTE